MRSSSPEMSAAQVVMVNRGRMCGAGGMITVCEGGMDQKRLFVTW